jgi:DNA-binding HxlR family transcriptional regulator
VTIEARSGCPINLTLEMLGDRWSLIVIRDIMFGNASPLWRSPQALRRRNRVQYPGKQAGALSPVWSSLTLRDPTHKQKTIYSLTEASIRLVPLLAHMGAWGCRYTPVSRELSIRAQLLEEGGKRMWEVFMAELRSTHLGAPAPRRSVLAELQAAFESTISRQSKTRTSRKTR